MSIKGEEIIETGRRRRRRHSGQFKAEVVEVAGCNENQSGPLYKVRCSEPVPPAERSSFVPRTPELDENLCKCIWDKLSVADKDTAKKMSEGNWKEIPLRDAYDYASRAGRIAVNCGP